jgi:uncharacterized protein YggU (UPF0235/DUF167 family)
MSDVKEFRVRVTPNAPREYLEEAPFDTLRIAVAAPTEGNRANDRVREMVAEHLSVPLKNVMIIKGTTSPSKTVRVYL